MILKFDLSYFFSDKRKNSLIYINKKDKNIVEDVIQHILVLYKLEAPNISASTFALFDNEWFIHPSLPIAILNENSIYRLGDVGGETNNINCSKNKSSKRKRNKSKCEEDGEICLEETNDSREKGEEYHKKKKNKKLKQLQVCDGNSSTTGSIDIAGKPSTFDRNIAITTQSQNVPCASSSKNIADNTSSSEESPSEWEKKSIKEDIHHTKELQKSLNLIKKRSSNSFNTDAFSQYRNYENGEPCVTKSKVLPQDFQAQFPINKRKRKHKKREKREKREMMASTENYSYNKEIQYRNESNKQDKMLDFSNLTDMMDTNKCTVYKFGKTNLTTKQQLPKDKRKHTIFEEEEEENIIHGPPTNHLILQNPTKEDFERFALLLALKDMNFATVYKRKISEFLNKLDNLNHNSNLANNNSNTKAIGDICSALNGINKYPNSSSKQLTSIDNLKNISDNSNNEENSRNSFSHCSVQSNDLKYSQLELSDEHKDINDSICEGKGIAPKIRSKPRPFRSIAHVLQNLKQAKTNESTCEDQNNTPDDTSICNLNETANGAMSSNDITSEGTEFAYEKCSPQNTTSLNNTADPSIDSKTNLENLSSFLPSDTDSSVSEDPVDDLQSKADSATPATMLQIDVDEDEKKEMDKELEEEYIEEEYVEVDEEIEESKETAEETNKSEENTINAMENGDQNLLKSNQDKNVYAVDSPALRREEMTFMEFIESCPLLTNLPRKGDIVALKHYVVDEGLRTTLSDYAAAVVVSVYGNKVILKNVKKEPPSGSQTLDIEEKTYTIDWRNAIQPRILFP